METKKKHTHIEAPNEREEKKKQYKHGAKVIKVVIIGDGNGGSK